MGGSAGGGGRLQASHWCALPSHGKLTAALSSPTLALRETLRNEALSLGFCKAGFCGVEPFSDGARRLAAWLEQGLQGEMGYLAGPRHDPTQLLPEARSLLVVAMAYPRAADSPVAAYAQCEDYHAVLKQKLRVLADRCSQLTGRQVAARACVDTAPLLEHEAAARAGVGFVSKSTLSIVPGVGSMVVLGELLLDIALEPDAPAKPRCGDCTACLEACPTRAFVGPYLLDARRCISYLTIEFKGPFPHPLRALIGERAFGCDVCQTVCPFNQGRGTARPGLVPRPELRDLSLVDLLQLGAAAYRKLVRGTALRRVTRAQLGRNAAVALGNSGRASAVEPLCEALVKSPYPLVRGHAAWALGRLGDAESVLRQATRDSDPSVREEAELALTSE